MLPKYWKSFDVILFSVVYWEMGNDSSVRGASQANSRFTNNKGILALF